MKKLALIVAALMTVGFAAPAFAADNLTLSGSYQLRGWDVDAENSTNDQSFFDQRMRVKAKITASDNAYVVIRADMGDGVWGRDFKGTIQRPGRYGSDSAYDNNSTQIDFDRLYGHFEKDNWALTVGQQFLGLGILEVLDANMVAAKLRLKFGAVEPSFIFGKISENGGVSSDGLSDDGNFDDANLYAVNLSFNVMEFDSNIFYALADNDGSETTTNAGKTTTTVADTNAWALGFYAAGKLGMVNLVSELTFLGGDASATTDYEGTQFYLKGDANLTDAFNLGGEFLWAAGQDGTDVQLTNLADFGDFTVVDTNAPSATDVVAIKGGSPFDFALNAAGKQANAGVVGATLFASYQIKSDLSVGGKLAYLTPEEDDNTNVDNLTSATAWVGYDLGSNTSLVLLYNIAQWDNDNAGDEDVNTLYARFLIEF